MNSKNLDEKPWENVNINEIQPYPSNYFKTVVLSYGLGAFIISFGLINKFVASSASEFLLFLLSQPLIYGALAFSLLYLYSYGHRKFMLSTLKNYLKFLIPFVLILTFIPVILLLIDGASVVKLLKVLMSSYIITSLILIFINMIFILMGVAFGPLSLIETEHPQGEIHGVIVFLIIISPIFLHLNTFLIPL